MDRRQSADHGGARPTRTQRSTGMTTPLGDLKALIKEKRKKKPAKKSKRSSGLFLRGDVWWFRRQIDGKRRAVTTGCKDQRQAERRKVEIEKDMNDGKLGWKPEPTKVVPTIEDYIETAYQAHYKHVRTGASILDKLNQL